METSMSPLNEEPNACGTPEVQPHPGLEPHHLLKLFDRSSWGKRSDTSSRVCLRTVPGGHTRGCGWTCWEPSSVWKRKAFPRSIWDRTMRDQLIEHHPPYRGHQKRVSSIFKVRFAQKQEALRSTGWVFGSMASEPRYGDTRHYLYCRFVPEPEVHRRAGGHRGLLQGAP